MYMCGVVPRSFTSVPIESKESKESKEAKETSTVTRSLAVSEPGSTVSQGIGTQRGESR